MLGIKDVALAAGVSQATASRALSGRGSVSQSTRERVRAAAAELGFQVSYHASSLATGRSRNIGVVLPHVNRWYFSTVLEGLTRQLIDAGYDLTLYDFQGDRHRKTVLNDFLLRKRLDGVITVGLRLGDEDATRLLSLGIPFVSIGGSVPGITSLLVDEHAIGRLAAEHLISLGHKRIAHVGGEHGRRDLRQLLVDVDPYNRPTAICCASDEMAIGVILAARDLGLQVPEQLSVIGVDKHPLGTVFGLTTVDQFVEDQGRRAALTLLDALSAPHIDDSISLPAPIELPVRIVARSSTAAPSSSPNPTFH